MNSMEDTELVASPASGQARYPHRVRALVGTGLVGTIAAMAATTLVAALAESAGVVFEVPDGGETIPLSGITFVTGIFSVVGVVLAVALLRWSANPAKRFVRTAVSLTAISLLPPFLVDAHATTTAALIGLHLVAATVMIPTLGQCLGTRAEDEQLTAPTDR